MLERNLIQFSLEENRSALQILMLEVTQHQATVFLPGSLLTQIQATLKQFLEQLKEIHKKVVEIIYKYRQHPSLTLFTQPTHQIVKSYHDYFMVQRISILSIEDEALARVYEEKYPLGIQHRLELELKEFYDELEKLVPGLKYIPDSTEKQQLLRTMAQTGELAEMATAASGEKLTKAERVSNLMVFFKALDLFMEGKDRWSTTELAKAAIKVVDVSLDYAKDCIEAFRSEDPTTHNKTTICLYMEGSRAWFHKLLRRDRDSLE